MIVLIVLMLSSTLLHASSDHGDPDKGGSASLEETEKYILLLLKDSLSFRHNGQKHSTQIEFRGTEVTVIEVDWADQTDRAREASTFNLKDLNPTGVTYSSKTLYLSATENRKYIQTKSYYYYTGETLPTPTVRTWGLLLVHVNPTMDEFMQRLANAFAHAIKLSGGQTELNDPFK